MIELYFAFFTEGFMT